MRDAPPAPTLRRADFVGGVWHGVALATALAVADINVVVPAFVLHLTGSAVWVGGFAALMAVAAAVPQFLIARFVEPRRRARPVLLAAIYLRASAWLGLSAMTLAVDAAHTAAMTASLFGFLGLFALGGALGSVPYTVVIGKVIPRARRGTFFATRQALGSGAGVAASALGAALLAAPYPDGYARVFLASGALIALSSAGIWAIREPPTEAPVPRRAWRPYLADLRAAAADLRGLAVVTWETGVHLLALPFYVVALVAAEDAPDHAVGLALAAMVVGSLAGNLAWGRLVDRHGAPRMLGACVRLGVLAPLAALTAPLVGWPALLVAAGLAGATRAGRSVGFASALLETAPASRRATYQAAYAFLTLPTALMPLLGGLIAATTSYEVLFIVTAALMATGYLHVASWARRHEGGLPSAEDRTPRS